MVACSDSVPIAVAAGGNHSCALLHNGQVFCWGLNSNGQLGIGNTSKLPTPSAVLLGE